MSLRTSPGFYPDEDLPNHNSTTGYFSDADSLLVNDGYSDNEEDGPHERSRVGRQEIISTRDEDDRTQEISPSEADSFETYENPVPHNYESTQVDVQRFLSQLSTPLSDLGVYHDFSDTTLAGRSQVTETLNNLKRKQEESLEELRSLRAKLQYHDMVVTQTMLGIEGDELAISMDMFDAENQERYLDEREMYYDDEDINPDHLPGLVDMNDMPPTTAEVGLETGDSQDTEKKKVDKGKGKAVDKGKGKARDKGKGRARASPYSLIASRTHHEGNGHIPRLGMTGYNRPDWISRILDRPTNFDNLYEGRNEFSHHSSAPHLDPYGYSVSCVFSDSR